MQTKFFHFLIYKENTMDNNNLGQPIKHRKISRWLQDASYRKANKKWLNYSGEIAMRILALIEEDKDMSQTKLAESLGVSKQYVNRIIQGKENLTLENIGKLSDAMGFELITFPTYRYQQKDKSMVTMVTKGKVIPMPIKDYIKSTNVLVSSTSIGIVKSVVNS